MKKLIAMLLAISLFCTIIVAFAEGPGSGRGGNGRHGGGQGSVHRGNGGGTDISSDTTNDDKSINSTEKTQYGSIEYHYSDDVSKELNYLLYVPDRVDQADLPLIVYLHGGSGRGNDLSKIVSGNSFPRFIKDDSLGNIAAYVLAPQCPADVNSWIDVSDEVFALIDKVTQEKAIDKNKIILTGNSLGGAGAWNIALIQPELFSCIVPMSGNPFFAYLIQG